MVLVDDYGPLRQAVLGGNLDPRLTLECFLLVKLGVRRVAIVTIPAELPDGGVLGAEVDFEFRSRLAGAVRDVRTRLDDSIKRRRLDDLAFKFHVLRSSFANHVLGSETYKAHRAAAKALGLEIQESEVRPTIHEWYVSLPKDRLDVTDLLRRRHVIQKESRTGLKANTPVTYYVYPEERDPGHLRTLGRLLGYPDCCVEEYVRGRVAGDGLTEAMPERRAASQLRRCEQARAAGATGGKPGGEAEPAAFWVKDFLPCRPDCLAAAAKGAQARAALSTIEPGFGELYDGLCRDNLSRVREGPDRGQ